MIDILFDLVLFRSKLTLKLLKSLDFESYFQERFNKNHQTIWLTKDITLSHQNFGEDRSFLVDAYGVNDKIDKLFVKVLWSSNIYKEIAYVLNEVSKIINLYAPHVDIDKVLVEISKRLQADFDSLVGMNARHFLRAIASVGIDLITEEFSDEV